MNKRHIKYSILFFGLILMLDFVSGKIFKESFSNISFGTYGEINESLKSESELLILGSSRAKHHYNPKQFEENLEISSYNSGLGGQGLFYNYAILKERIRTKKPKTVILDIAPNVIVDKESYSKLNMLLPYYEKHAAFQEIIKLDSKFSKLELISNLYTYNSTLYDFVRSKFSNNDNDNDFGYDPLQGEINTSSYVPFYLEDEKVDANKEMYFSKILELCEQNKIRLIVVVSPTYEKFDQNNKIIKKFQAILEKRDIEFYDYSDFDELYSKPIYFTDQLHLNSQGADIFSKELIKRIYD